MKRNRYPLPLRRLSVRRDWRDTLTGTQKTALVALAGCGLVAIYAWALWQVCRP